MSHNLPIGSVWYHLGNNHSTRAVVNILASLQFHTKTKLMYIEKLTQTIRSIFHNIRMTYHVNVTEQGYTWASTYTCTNWGKKKSPWK